MLNTEQSIINMLIESDDYFMKVNPILKPEYFKDLKLRTIYKAFAKTVYEKDIRPSHQDIATIIERDKSVDQETYTDIIKELDTIFKDKSYIDYEIFADTTLGYVKERAFVESLLYGMQLVKSGKKDLLGDAKERMEESLSIDFDDDLGFDVFDRESAEKRFEKYRDINTLKSGFMPWDIFTGGMDEMGLHLISSPVNGGKSLSMGYLAACYAQFVDTIYFTCEMQQEKISARMEVSMMDIELNDLRRTITEKEDYLKMFDMMCESRPNHKKLWIKEFPTGTASASTIKNFLKRLRTTKKFRPQVIVIDYIGILAADRKVDFSDIYSFQGAIATELRAMSMQLRVPIISAAQLSRDAMKKITSQQQNADINMEDMGGSKTIIDISDQIILQIPIKKDNENFKQYINDHIKSVYLWINAKTRNSDNKDERLVIGVNSAKMTLYELDNPQSQTTKINQSVVNKMQESDINSWIDDFADI